MKRQESMDIKKVSKENSERLKELKNQGERKNREKVNKIKSSVLTSKRKVEFFWEQRKRFYTEQHAMETMVNEQTKALTRSAEAIPETVVLVEKYKPILLKRKPLK